jgi:hypothetical protein
MARTRHNIEQATNGFVVALYVAAALFLAVAGFFLLQAAASSEAQDTQDRDLRTPFGATLPAEPPSLPALPLA